MPQLVLTDMKPRLVEAAAAAEDARDAYRAAVELRNQLVVAAVDAGMSQRAVAAAARVTVSRVSGILLDASGDELTSEP